MVEFLHSYTLFELWRGCVAYFAGLSRRVQFVVTLIVVSGASSVSRAKYVPTPVHALCTMVLGRRTNHSVLAEVWRELQPEEVGSIYATFVSIANDPNQKNLDLDLIKKKDFNNNLSLSKHKKKCRRRNLTLRSHSSNDKSPNFPALKVK